MSWVEKSLKIIYAFGKRAKIKKQWEDMIIMLKC